MQLRERQDELDRLGMQVLVVSFEDGPVAAAYARDMSLAWPLVLDPSRQLFQAYDMDRGSLWKVMGPGNWWFYLKLLLRGRRLHRPSGDVYQLGGDVLIDPAGTVRLHRITTTSTDRPAVEEIVQLVRAFVMSGRDVDASGPKAQGISNASQDHH